MDTQRALHPLNLASYAAACLKGREITGVGPSTRQDDISSAMVRFKDGNRFHVRSAHTPESSTNLLTESHVAALITGKTSKKHLNIPTPMGRYTRGNLVTVLYDSPWHRPLQDQEIENNEDVQRGIGEAIAAIHRIPAHACEDAGLPFMEAHEVRARLLSQLDDAASTGRVPSLLLDRWEHLLDEASLWRFTPTVIHAELHEGCFYRCEQGLLLDGFHSLRVSDPAQDFTWLMSYPPQIQEEVLGAYDHLRAEAELPRDENLRRRALFLAEFALADFLMSAIRSRQEEKVEQATELLTQLAERVKPAPATRPSQSEDTQESTAEHTTQGGSTQGDSTAEADATPAVRPLGATPPAPDESKKTPDEH